MKYYYATKNTYGNSTSVGFANTWKVLVFTDKTSRDEYIDSSNDMSVGSINKADIKKYVDAPKPFSGQRRAIDTRSADGGAPFYGTIELMYPYEGVDL